MTTNQKINKDPFGFLDMYPEEAYQWAEEVWAKIHSKFTSDSFDMDMMSIAFAHVYSDFTHVSMRTCRDDFEDYLLELYGEEQVNEKWDLMWNYSRVIYDAMLLAYGSDSKILESLRESMLVKSEEEENVYIIPMGFSEGDALSFVGEKFHAPSEGKKILERSAQKEKESSREIGQRMNKAFVEGLNRQVLIDHPEEGKKDK